MAGTAGSQPQFGLEYQYIDCKCLAQRWGVPESWVRDQVRGRSADPIPHVRLSCGDFCGRTMAASRYGSRSPYGIAI